MPAQPPFLIPTRNPATGRPAASISVRARAAAASVNDKTANCGFAIKSSEIAKNRQPPLYSIDFRRRREKVPSCIPRCSLRGRAANAVSLQLHALASNLGNFLRAFLRALATPEPIKDWSLASLKEKLIKIGAKIVSQGCYVAFQMAEIAIPRNLFAEILRLVAELRPASAKCHSGGQTPPKTVHSKYAASGPAGSGTICADSAFI
jgi:Transposase DDE domain group 1